VRRTIRSGRGLGDSIYLASIVRHIGPEKLHVFSDYPELFGGAKVSPHARKASIVAHYVSRKGITQTDQFQDMCISAGLKKACELRLDWKTSQQTIDDMIGPTDRPILCVQLPRSPMGRTDGFGASLLPDCRAIQRAINMVRGRALVVQIGAGDPLFKFSGIDIDLANKTNISQLLDIASVSSAFLGYVSFVIPLAESFNKPALIIWSKKGMRSSDPFIARITPKKIIHKPIICAAIDDCKDDELESRVNEILHA
jgi:hypothetical protein